MEVDLEGEFRGKEGLNEGGGEKEEWRKEGNKMEDGGEEGWRS